MNHPLILRVAQSGYPICWETWENTVSMYCKNLILPWGELGEHETTIYGGVNASTGERSKIKVNSIITTKGKYSPEAKHYTTPPVDRSGVFRRDKNICMYCGSIFAVKVLTIDHVLPEVQGGKTTWNNLVTACKSCNNRKDRKTPEEAHMPLLAIPYTPNRAEYLILKNRRILYDQMEFLIAQVGSDSRLKRN